jgi:hypothetical protein
MPMPEIADAIKELSSASSPAPAPEPSAPAPEPSALGGEEHDFRQESESARARDESGKFSPKAVAKDEILENEPEKVETDIPPAPKPEDTGQPQGIKPPVSWKPEEREGWEKIDPRHQQAILRRERETSNALTQSHQAREFTQQMQQVLQPYMPMISAEQATPIQAISTLLQTAATLRTAPTRTKADLVADLMIQYQIDPETLDNVLSAKLRGQPSPNDPVQQILAQVDQRLQPITQFIGTLEQQRTQAAQRIDQEASQTLDQFMKDPANEFAADVSEDMADLLELAAKRGFTLSLQDAYRRATLAHPTISKIMERRMLTGGAAQQTAAAQRARQASASVHDSGAPSQTVGEDDGKDDIRSALTASIKSLSQRR